jgi:hypothetical protein
MDMIGEVDREVGREVAETEGTVIPGGMGMTEETETAGADATDAPQSLAQDETQEVIAIAIATGASATTMDPSASQMVGPMPREIRHGISMVAPTLQREESLEATIGNV